MTGFPDYPAFATRAENAMLATAAQVVIGPAQLLEVRRHQGRVFFKGPSAQKVAAYTNDPKDGMAEPFAKCRTYVSVGWQSAG
jgi:hypothetical protein